MSSAELVHAYRQLLRAGLRAVRFSQPSKSVITKVLRDGFRDPRGTFEAERVRRTVWFLLQAGAKRGLEHKILKNLCRVHWERMNEARRTPWRVHARAREGKGVSKRVRDPDVIKGSEYEDYERTIAMLNDTMEMCLR